MGVLLNFLLKNGYKQPKVIDFKNKIKRYFGITEITESESVLNFLHPKGYEIDIENQYIDIFEVDTNYLQENKTLETNINDDINNRFICYNKIIFNDDIPSITKILHDKKALEDLVIYFDYENNPMLLNFALNSIDLNNNEIIYIEHLIFYNDKTRQEPIKENLLLKILDKDETFFVQIIQSLVEFWEKFHTEDLNKYRSLAFLLNELLKKHHKEIIDFSTNEGFLILNNVYVENQTILDYFNNQDYYNYELLKKYSNTYNNIKEIA